MASQSHSVVRAHELLLEAAKGFEQYIIEGQTDFTLTCSYKVSSFARYLALWEHIRKLHEVDFQGVIVESVSLPLPEGAEMHEYGNFAKAFNTRPWEPKASDVVTDLVIQAKVPGAIKLKPEDFAPGMPNTITGEIKERLAYKLKSLLQLPFATGDVDWLLEYTVDALFIGTPTSNSLDATKYFPRQEVYFRKLLGLHGNEGIQLRFGPVLESNESYMVVQAVWTAGVSARGRRAVQESIYRHIGASGTVDHVEFLVW